MRIKSFVRRVLNRLGYDIVRWRLDVQPRGFNSAHLSTICRPQTVFDIGVGNGTYALYEAFPDAKFILVEPVREYEETINRIKAQYECRVYYKAVGSAEGQLELTVDLDDPEKSSLETRARLTAREHSLEKRIVEVTTLDAIMRANPDLKRPVLVKLDTEGHELEALRGGTELLRIADMVICEVSVAKRFEGGYGFEDIIGYMSSNGFRLADILSIAHATGEIEPRHMDVVFTRTDRTPAESAS